MLAVVCFALGAVMQRWYDTRRVSVARGEPVRAAPARIDHGAEAPVPVTAPIHFEHEPLWAYGFESPPKSGEKAAPQAAPSRALRPKQDPVEQTRARHIDGSAAAYSLVDVRDGQNVVDWFPGDHPAMPDVVAHGPARMGPLKRGCALVPSAEREGTS